MEINNNEEEFYSSINVTGTLSFQKDTPMDYWLLNRVKNLGGSTISLPLDWVQVNEVNKHTKWPSFTSLAKDRIENERLRIPVAAFQFWEQQDFKEMLNEIMDKSTLYKSTKKRKKLKE